MKNIGTNRQAIADLNEMVRIARQIEERRNNNRILDLEMRVQMQVVKWLGEAKVQNPLRPVGPALARARLALRASKLSTRSIGRARDYVAELQSMTRITIREALQERIAAGDAQAAETLHVFEVWAPEQLDTLSAEMKGLRR
jgi:hypothetical protein